MILQAYKMTNKVTIRITNVNHILPPLPDYNLSRRAKSCQNLVLEWFLFSIFGNSYNRLR